MLMLHISLGNLFAISSYSKISSHLSDIIILFNSVYIMNSSNRKRKGRRFTQPEEKEFLEFFSKLLAYEESFGTYNVPMDYVVEDEGKEYHLGMWLHSQLMMLSELRDYPFLDSNLIYLVDSGQLEVDTNARCDATVISSDCNNDKINNNDIDCLTGKCEEITLSSTPLHRRPKVARRSNGLPAKSLQEFKLDFGLFDSSDDYVGNIDENISQTDIMMLSDGKEQISPVMSDVFDVERCIEQACIEYVEPDSKDNHSDKEGNIQTIDPTAIEKADIKSIVGSIERRDIINIDLIDDVVESLPSMSLQEVMDIESNIESIISNNDDLIPAENLTDSFSIHGDIIGFPFEYPDRRLALGIGLVCNSEVLFDKALVEKTDLFVTFFTPADSADPLFSVYNLDVEETLVIKKHSVLLWNIAFKRGIAYIHSVL